MQTKKTQKKKKQKSNVVDFAFWQKKIIAKQISEKYFVPSNDIEKIVEEFHKHGVYDTGLIKEELMFYFSVKTYFK